MFYNSALENFWSNLFLTRVISRLHEPMKSSDCPCQLTSRSYTRKETLVWKTTNILCLSAIQVQIFFENLS